MNLQKQPHQRPAVDNHSAAFLLQKMPTVQMGTFPFAISMKRYQRTGPRWRAERCSVPQPRYAQFQPRVKREPSSRGSPSRDAPAAPADSPLSRHASSSGIFTSLFTSHFTAIHLTSLPTLAQRDYTENGAGSSPVTFCH